MNDENESKSDASDPEIKKYQSLYESLDKNGRMAVGNHNVVKIYNLLNNIRMGVSGI